MALFKLTDTTRKRTVAVFNEDDSENLEEIIQTAVKKLRLCSNLPYSLMLEKDGTEIDSYKILKRLYKGEETLFMVVEEGYVWEPPTEFTVSPVAASTPALTPAATSTTATASLSCSSNSGERREEVTSTSTPKRAYHLPLEEVVPMEFKNNDKNASVDKLELIRNVAKFMKDRLQDCSLGAAGKMAAKLIAHYPLAFQTTLCVNGEKDVIDDGLNTLKMKIYDCARYRNRGTSKNRSATSVNGKSKKQKLIRYEKGQDSYGCVEYEPDKMPDGETEETLQEKKKALLKDFENAKLTKENITALLNATYYVQRKELNHRDECSQKNSKEDDEDVRDIEDEAEKSSATLQDVLKNDWPHLTMKEYFFDHSSRLLGKNVKATYLENLKSKLPNVLSYIEWKINAEKQKPSCSKFVKSGSEELQMAKAAGDGLETNASLPRSKAFFSVLSDYFGESKIFVVVDPGTSDEHLMEIGDSTRPILAVKGTSIYDELSECSVVIEKGIVLDGLDFLDGVLGCFLTHYTYGYNYSSNSSATWEFIQRVFLEINPSEGHKRRQNPTSKVNAKVKKLMTAVQTFTK